MYCKISCISVLEENFREREQIYSEREDRLEQRDGRREQNIVVGSVGLSYTT